MTIPYEDAGDLPNGGLDEETVTGRGLSKASCEAGCIMPPHTGPYVPAPGRVPSPVNLADRRRITAPEHVWAAHGHPGEVCESLSPERPFLCALRAEKEADRG